MAEMKNRHSERAAYHYDRASYFSEMGEELLARHHAGEVRYHLRKARQLSGKKEMLAGLEAIEKTAYANGVEFYSRRAGAFASMGEINFAISDLVNAKACEEKSGIKIPRERLRELEETAGICISPNYRVPSKFQNILKRVELHRINF